MDVTDRVFLLMEKSNITAAKLTREISLTNGLVSQWKKGKQKPSSDAIIKLANYFNVTTDYLLMGKEKDSTNTDYKQDSMDTELLEIFHQLPLSEKKECIAYFKGYLAHSLKTTDEAASRKKAL